MENLILFRNRLIYFQNSKSDNMQLAMSIAAELMRFGFIPDQSALDMMSLASSQALEEFYYEVIKYLKDITGSNGVYTPFWKGFPFEVMEKSELELWQHQLCHYWSQGLYEPNEWTKSRPEAFERGIYTIYRAGTSSSLNDIFVNLTTANQSLAPQDRKDVVWLAQNAKVSIPEHIPFKETLCLLAMLGLDVPVKTVTDVLRIAVAMSGGDISLPAVPKKFIKSSWGYKTENSSRYLFKFKKFSRKERVRILSLFEKTNCSPEEAILKDQRFIRLGEIIHPGEYRNRFPKTYEMFNKIRNEKITSWYGQVDSTFNTSFDSGLIKLAERPGEFMRRLDYLLRTFETSFETSKILKVLEELTDKVSNKVLFEAYTHFSNRTVSKDRFIMVKGARKPIKLPALQPLSENLVDLVQGHILKALESKFSKLPSLGKVWVDPNLALIPIPTNMRSMLDGFRPAIRGQKIPLSNPNTKVIRAFVHWTDELGNQDIDLTGTFLSDKGVKDLIGWNGSYNSKLGTYSGDIRHRKGNCAEYVDVNIENAINAGYKYLVLDARSYTGKPFKSVTNCVFGYMEREFPEAGKIFLPETLANTFRLDSNSTSVVMSYFDLEEKIFVFLDMDQSGIPVASRNIQGMLDLIKSQENKKFTVYDLALMHVVSRGVLANSRNEADTVFDYEPFAESYKETLKWLGV